MFEANDRETIKNRMLQNVASGYSKIEGSFPYDMISPIGIELEQAYGNLDTALAVAFPQTSSGVYLEMKAAEHGVYRKAPNKATGTVRFEGAAGTVIPLGTKLKTAGDVEFVTIKPGTIGSYVFIALRKKIGV